MDVNEVQKTNLTPKISLKSSQGGSTQKPLLNLAADKVTAAQIETAAVKIDTKPRENTESTENRKRANNLINLVNGIEDATSEIGNMIESLDGIVEQAETPGLTPARTAVLEKEAQEIAGVLKERSASSENTIESLNTSALDSVAEKELEKTLETIFQDAGKNSFGIENIALSPPENIIKTRANINEARKRLENLRENVDSAKTEAKELVSKLEVALQNAEAADTSVRDIDSALELTSNLELKITENPDKASEATRLDGDSLSLLK